MQPNITAWLNSTLEGLIDYAPDTNDEYMPCYLKVDNLLEDCRAYLKVFYTNYILFVIYTQQDTGTLPFQLPKKSTFIRALNASFSNLRFPKKTKLGIVLIINVIQLILI